MAIRTITKTKMITIEKAFDKKSGLFVLKRKTGTTVEKFPLDNQQYHNNMAIVSERMQQRVMYKIYCENCRTTFHSTENCPVDREES